MPDDDAPARRLLVGALGAPLLLAAGLAAVHETFRLPEPVPKAEAGTGFSAERALSTLRFLAPEPRPVGSEAHGRIRRWLTTEIRTAGHVPEVQAGELHGYALSNVLVRIQGHDSTGAVLVVSHYDSRPETPGSSDDGIGVVAMLQMLELLPAGGALRNDVLLLFTDGEELGLLGAELFRQHPRLADVAAVVNLEAIGNHGPFVMFQTGPGSGALVEQYAAVAPHPVTTSLAPAIYERLPNDTDFTVFLREGLPGLNLAVVGGGSAYHRPIDTPDNLDLATLQLAGDTALALTRALGDADLASLQREDTTYFDVLARVVLRYGAPWNAVAAAATLALVLLGIFLAWKRDGASPRGMLAGVLWFLVYAGGTGLVTYGVWYGVREVIALAGWSTPGAPRGNQPSTAWTLAGIAMFVMGLLCWLLERRANPTAPDQGVGTEAVARARLSGFTAGALFVWGSVLAWVWTLGPHAGAQLVPALGLAALVFLLGNRAGLLGLLASLGVAVLVFPVIGTAVHLMSTSPFSAAFVASAALPLALGLMVPYLRCGEYPRGLRILMLAGGLALLVQGARVAAGGS